MTDRESSFSLKDELFNRHRVSYLANLLAGSDDSFEAKQFVRQVMRNLASLELKERIVHIAAVLEKHLAEDFPTAAKQLTKSLPPPLDSTKTDDDFGDFIFAPLGEFVVRNGLAKRHLKLSLRTLQALTQRFSMEDAIRAFINAHPEETFATLENWSRHKNYHVRRLVSEGTRPKLPWSKRLKTDLLRPLPLLDQLHKDPTRYVTRSVANHLNDIAKTDPNTVIATLKRWQQESQQDPQELAWMTRHALRTLIKQGNPRALQLLGFRTKPKIEVEAFRMLSASVRPGEAFEFTCTIRAKRKEAILIDYVVDFVKANGQHKPKVHKFKQVMLNKDECLTLRKRHILRANATTYTLYPGTHYVTLQINGAAHGRVSFELRK